MTAHTSPSQGGDAAPRTPVAQAVAAAAARIRAFLPAGAAPKVALVLGSGLGEYAERLRDARAVSYADIGFPQSRVQGHAGRLVYGFAPADRAAGPGDLPVLCMQGRVHAYEGHDLETVVLPVRALIAAGCKTVVLTNAAGGILSGLSAGQLVILRDHLNLFGSSPLRGENDPTLGPRFPDMSSVYDPALRDIAKQVGERLGMRLPSGVYAGCLGPQYETPAEVRMLRVLGADMVGMSTVPEAIAARHMGARVLGISCVTNLAAGITDQPLSHDEVTETADRVRGEFLRLLDGILAELAQR